MAGGRAKKRRRRRRAGPPRPAAGEAVRADQTEKEVDRAERASSSSRRHDPGGTRPEAPWGGFPLAELLVFAGIIFMVWGAIGNRPVTIAVGLGLASLGGLELSIREHFGGYRSHTLLLAGVAGVATVAATSYLTSLVLGIALSIGAAVFGAAFFALRRAFRRASGGYNFRIGGFKG